MKRNGCLGERRFLLGLNCNTLTDRFGFPTTQVDGQSFFWVLIVHGVSLDDLKDVLETPNSAFIDA